MPTLGANPRRKQGENKMSNFLKTITAERITAENQKIPAKMENLVAIRMARIVTFLMALIAGTAKKVPGMVDEVTEAVMKFIELGGLKDPADAPDEEKGKGIRIFRDFFEKHPDMFYALSLPELWVAIKDYPDLQDHIAKVYYDRLMPYEGQPEHFHWAVKAVLNILTCLPAPPADMSFQVDKICEVNSKLLMKDDQTHIWNILQMVKADGEYRRPKPKVVTVADKAIVFAADGAVQRQGKKKKNAKGGGGNNTDVPIDGPTSAKTEGYSNGTAMAAALSASRVN